jgi:hemerythrin
VTVSIGIASWPVHADNPQGLVAAADAALYVAKGEGRNRSVVASRPGAPIPEPTAVLPLIHLPWCDSYSLGHPVIDAQHMKLLALSNALLDAVSSGKDYPEVEAALDALLRHTQEHFSDEEKVLADAEYPHVQGHLDAHHHLLQTAQRMKLEFHQGRLSFRALLDFIVNRMVNDHMLQEDMAYKSWLIEHDGLE